VAAEVAHGGIDLVKDDEVLADASFSHVAERCRAVRLALDKVAAETGHRAHYVVSITDRTRRMRDHLRAAQDGGADGVMVAALMVGLDALQEVVEELDGALPVIAHTAGLDMFGGRDGLTVAPEILVGRLMRLAGADAVLIGSPWARRRTPEPLWQRMADLLRDPWGALTRAFPVVGGGVVAEQLADVVGLLGIDVIVTRPFNHVGARQSPAFAVSGMTRQIVAIERGEMEPVIHVGNLNTARDITDVRDTVRAYALLMERGLSGTVYNIASGRGITIRAMLDQLVAMSRSPLEVKSKQVNDYVTQIDRAAEEAIIEVVHLFRANVVDVGTDALVIEATYLDEEGEMASDFSHLTARRAAELAVQAGVKHLILTHISRRYRERDVVAEARSFFPGAVVARDFDVFQIKRGECIKIEGNQQGE